MFLLFTVDYYKSIVLFIRQSILNSLSSERAAYPNTGQSPVKKMNREILKPCKGGINFRHQTYFAPSGLNYIISLFSIGLRPMLMYNALSGLKKSLELSNRFRFQQQFSFITHPLSTFPFAFDH